MPKGFYFSITGKDQSECNKVYSFFPSNKIKLSPRHWENFTLGESNLNSCASFLGV